MRHEEPHDAAAARDSKCLDLFGQRRLLLIELETLQRGDHLLASGKSCATRVGPELALAGEPHHDHACQETEHYLRNDHRHEVGRTVTALDLEHGAIHDVAHDPGQEDHESIDHALDERE